MIGNIYTTLLYQPTLNVLVMLYQYSPIRNFGIAIILITILSRIILYPLNKKMVESQKAMQRLKPELDKLKEKHKDDKEKLYAETMQLYTKNKINPLSGCLPLLIQLPIFWALYQALREGLNPEHLDKVNGLLYSFVPKLTSIHTDFLWFNLTKPDPTFILPILVAAGQFLQTRTMMGRSPVGKNNPQAQAAMFMPLFFLFIALSLPSGLNLYILLTSLFGVVQQIGVKEFFRFTWLKQVIPTRSKKS